MAVSEQTPYKEYTANGSTNSFALEFDCENQDHLIVLVDDVEPVVGTWSLSGGAVVFGTAPEDGKKITIQRNTPVSRSTNFQSFNNSFRPDTINKDLDRIWFKLQELGVTDWLLQLYIDRLHSDQKTYIDQKDTQLQDNINSLSISVDLQDVQLQQNINNLKNYVDDKDDELRAYLLDEIRKQGVALDQLDDYYNYLMQRLAQIAVQSGWEASFVVDASGKTQQEINDKTSAFIGTTVTPEMFKKVSDTDWTSSLSQAITYALNHKCSVQLGAKIYTVSSPLPRITQPIAIHGEGQRKTWIKYNKLASGTCLSTQDVNFHDSGSTQLDSNSTTIDIEDEKSGVSLRGFTIVGDRSSVNEQNGLLHYGLTDNLDLADVGIHNIKGVGWGFAPTEGGNPANTTGIRESLLGHINVRRCGDAVNNKPAIHFYSDGYDPSNGVSITRLDSIWADGECIRFENAATNNEEVRYIRILSGMIHGREKVENAPQTTPIMVVAGRFVACTFGFTEISGSRNDQYSVHFHKNGIGMARNCSLPCSIGGQGNGVWIEHGRDIHLNGDLIRVAGASLRLGGGANVLGNIFINGIAEDLQYAKFTIINEGNPNRIIYTHRGGPFLVKRTASEDKFSAAGGLMANNSDGLKLALLSHDGVLATTGLELNRYTATDDTEIVQTSVTNGFNFVPRTKFSDTEGQVYVETRGGLYCFVFQRTLSTGRKTITWNTQPPIGGTWFRGDIIFNSTPSFGAELGWICIESGVAGIWTPLGQNAMPSVSIDNLQSIGHAINTTGKYNTKMVINSTDKKLYYATTATAAAPWVSVDGVSVVTPV